jgi:hypothetical protein
MKMSDEKYKKLFTIVWNKNKPNFKK